MSPALAGELFLFYYLSIYLFLAGEFLTTRPPEKPLAVILICISLMISDIEHLFMYLAFLIAQLVKSLPAMQETLVRFQG